jgi:hypothetical protein
LELSKCIIKNDFFYKCIHNDVVNVKPSLNWQIYGYIVSDRHLNDMYLTKTKKLTVNEAKDDPS